METALTEELGDSWKKYGTAKLLHTYYEVSEYAEGDTNKLTLSTMKLVEIYQLQQAKKLRIENYNERMKSQTDENA